jgi:hypothetical protein
MELKLNKAQGEVISSILLILIVIGAIVALASYVINFVKDKIKSSDCSYLFGKVEIKESMQYTCYNSTDQYMLVQVHISDVLDRIKGFVIVLGGKDSKSYKIYNDSAPADVSMFGLTDPVHLPGNNLERVYKISFVPEKPDQIEIYPILKNNVVCELSDSELYVNSCV